MTDDDQLPTTDAEFPESPEAAQAADELPDIPAEQLKLYLAVWRTAWVSGYVSAGINTLAQSGVDEATRQHFALHLEHRAVHAIRNILEDPLVRNGVVVDAIQHVVSGKVDGRRVSREVRVHCADRDHGTEGGHRG